MGTTKTPNPRDRRVRRTHERLREALISLILEKGYNAVSIRDVVARANVGRSTFYIHFGSIEEVLMGHDNQSWLRHFGQQERKRGKLFAFSLPFLEHAHERRALWRALVGNKGGLAIQKHFRQNLLAAVREDLLQLYRKQDPRVTEVMARFLSGAYAEMLFWWLDSPSSLTPQDVDRLFRSLTGSALGLREQDLKVPVPKAPPGDKLRRPAQVRG